MIFILLTSCFSITAQPHRQDAFFLSAEGVVGNYTGLNLNLNYQFRQRYSIAIGMDLFERDIQDLLPDYDARHEVSDFHLLIGRAFPSRKGKIRWNLAIGMAQSRSVPPKGLQIDEGDLLDMIAGNALVIGDRDVDVDYLETNKFAFIINPKLEIPLSNVFGLSFSVIYMTNDVKPVIGAGIGLITGKLR